MEFGHFAVSARSTLLCSCASLTHARCSYEMLFGLPPFYSENLNEMYRGIISAPLTFPTDFPVSQDVTGIIRGFLTRDPLRRLGSSGDIAEGALVGGCRCLVVTCCAAQFGHVVELTSRAFCSAGAAVFRKH